MGVSKSDNILLEKAYADAGRFANSHYENFPVVSLFLPKKLRRHVAVIYQFARIADDIADEGEYSPGEKIKSLSSYQQKFEFALHGKFESGFWLALYNTIEKFDLNPQNFRDLVSAFEQDISTNRYSVFDDLLNYCRRSANPVGRLLLELSGIKDEEIFGYSDSVCTGLQLTNFYQDVSVDFLKGRIYIPLEDMQKFGVTEKTFELRENSINFVRLMEYQVYRNFEFYITGKKIIKYLPPGLARQIKWTIAGGETILKKIISSGYDVLNKRPFISKKEFFIIMMKNNF